MIFPSAFIGPRGRLSRFLRVVLAGAMLALPVAGWAQTPFQVDIGRMQDGAMLERLRSAAERADYEASAETAFSFRIPGLRGGLLYGGDAEARAAAGEPVALFVGEGPAMERLGLEAQTPYLVDLVTEGDGISLGSVESVEFRDLRGGLVSSLSDADVVVIIIIIIILTPGPP